MLAPSFFTTVFILPIVGPLTAVLVLLAVGARRQFAPGLLALLALVLACLLAQGLLRVVGWCLSPLATGPAAPTCLPWYSELFLAPVCYLYLWVLGQEYLRQPGSWRYLLPGLGQVSLFAGVAVLGFGYRQITKPGSGPPSAALGLLHHVVPPLAILAYGLLLFYGLQTLTGARRTVLLTRGASRLFRGQLLNPRPLVFLLVLGFGLVLGFVAVEVWFGPFAYSELWFAFAVRAGLVFGLAVAGIQAIATQTEQVVSPDDYQSLRLRRVACANYTGRMVPMREAFVHEPLPDAPSVVPTVEQVAPISTLAADLVPWHVRLLALMEDQRPWLEPELTLPQLAQRLGIHANQLSRIINTGCGQNFHDFVNSYRVAEARRLLADPRFAHYSVVGVALASGFNSKSTFNRVFKKLTAQAPSEVGRPNV